MNCVFCKIVKKEIPAEIVYEDKEIMGFKNVQTEAPIHLLLIPKRHIEWKNKFKTKNSIIFNKLILAAKKVAQKQNIFSACKLIFNVGKTGHITHIHLHLIGGWKKKIPMRNI